MDNSFPTYQIQEDKPKSKNITLYVLIGIICITLTVVVSIFLLMKSRVPEEAIKPTSTGGGATTTPPVQFAQTFTPVPISFTTGKHYFLDNLIVISKTSPRIMLEINAGRSEVADGKFRKFIRVNYFDGTTWTYKSDIVVAETPNITPTTLIPSWSTQIDKSRLLREQSQVQVELDNNHFKITTDVLSNDMLIRSLPEYTKFMSEGRGTLSINDAAIPVYISYSRIFSSNFDQLPVTDTNYYDKDNDVLTDWLLFWDADENFYFVDVTHVGENMSVENYTSHALGIKKSNTGAVQTTFNVGITHDSLTNPRSFTIDLGKPINQTVEFTPGRTIPLSQAFKKWILGNAEGSVKSAGQKTTTGFGIFEYIYN